MGLMQHLSTFHVLNSWLSEELFAVITFKSTDHIFTIFHPLLKRLRCNMAICGNKD